MSNVETARQLVAEFVSLGTAVATRKGLGGQLRATVAQGAALAALDLGYSETALRKAGNLYRQAVAPDIMRKDAKTRTEDEKAVLQALSSRWSEAAATFRHYSDDTVAMDVVKDPATFTEYRTEFVQSKPPTLEAVFKLASKLPTQDIPKLISLLNGKRDDSESTQGWLADVMGKKEAEV